MSVAARAPPAPLGIGRESRFYALGPVPDGIDCDPLTAYAVNHDIGSPPDHQFSNSGLGAGAAQMGMMSKSFDDGHDARRQSLCGGGIIKGYVGADFRKARSRQR